MNAVAVTQARSDEPLRLTLPPGAGNALCRLRILSTGVLSVDCDVRGTRMRIDAPVDGDVLFPTDVGLSLLAALNGDLAIKVDGARVLDVGCGSGLFSVALLLAGAAHVTALDINAACAAATVDNVARNGIDVARVSTSVTDLARLEVAQPWDIVVCNPPHLPRDASYATGDGIEAALVGGDDGRALYDVLLARLDDLLAAGGMLLLVHSSLTNIGRTSELLERAGYRCRTVQVCELDIPLRRYASYRHVLLARLYALRTHGSAVFRGLRFEVHTLVATRVASDRETR